METSSTTINHLEDFLVSSGPKQDFLVHVCKYIDVYDMVNLSESSKHSELFMEFFKERVIDLNSFDIKPKEIESFKKVFENFGPHMQRVKVITGIPLHHNPYSI